MTEMVILGSGCGFAVQDRNNPCIALLVDERSYLLDCGEPAAGSLFRAGIDPLSVRAIFVSHLHPDHVGGLAQVLSSVSMSRRAPEKKVKEWSISRDDNWYQSAIRFPESIPEGGPKLPVDLFIPAEGISGISAYLDAVYLSSGLLPFKFNISPVEPGRFYQDDRVSVSAIHNLHIANNPSYKEFQKNHPEIKLQSYSFMIEVEGVRIVYSGDIDNLHELVPFIDGADVLVVEIAHFDPQGIKDFIDQTSLEKIILSHIHPGLETPIFQMVDKWLDPRIIMAQDGLSVQI